MDIKPSAEILGQGKTGNLPHDLAEEVITARLGFAPNTFSPDAGPSFDGKVTIQWDFTVDGVPCSIWDYRGVRWSTWGPSHILARLFNSYEATYYSRMTA